MTCAILRYEQLVLLNVGETDSGCIHMTQLDASLGDIITHTGIFKALRSPAVQKFVNFCELNFFAGSVEYETFLGIVP